MQKTYIGEVIRSEKNEFTDRDGALVQNWLLSIALTEEKCMVFNVNRDNSPDLWQRIQDCMPGMVLKCTAEAKDTREGIIKWRLVEVEQN